MSKQPNVSGPIRENGKPLKLRGRRQKIYEALVDVDEALGNAYQGAIRVLGDRQNPDRIAQAAHSIREIANMISRRVDLPIRIKDDQKKQNLSEKLPKALDPRGGVPHMRDVYKEWVRKHKWFTNVSHHGAVPSPSEFNKKLRDLEEFLVELVFKPHLLTMDEVDQIVKKRHKQADIRKLRMLLSSGYEIYRYFFERVDRSWLLFLKENGFFRRAPDPEHEGDYIRFPLWPESQYLARIANELPKDVIRTLLDCKLTDKSNPRVYEDFVDAAIRMPQDIGVKLIKKIEREKWIENSYDLLLCHKLNDFLEQLIKTKMYEFSLDLAAILLDVRLAPLEDGKGRLGGPDVEGYIEDHKYEQTLKTITKIPSPELKPFLRLLVKILCKAISLETGTERLKGKYVKDNSYVWRPAIEDSEQNWDFHDVKDLLVGNIRDLLEAYMRHLKRKKRRSLNKELEDILIHAPDFSVLMRLRIHLYRLFPNSFRRQIKQVILSHFDDISVWHEYSLLLGQRFSRLDRRTRDKYLGLVQTGPVKKEKDRGYVNYWKTRHLVVIKKHLGKAELKEYEELLASRPEPEQPEFLMTHGNWWAGPTSPLTKESLLSEPVDQAIDHLIRWQPSNDEFSPSPEGLGRTFAEVVEERAKDYSRYSGKFLNPEIRPVYVYHFFSGLRNAVKKAAEVDWDEIIRLSAGIVDQFKTSRLPDFEKTNDRLEIDWDDVLGAIADLLHDGLSNQGLEPDFGLRNDIFEIISYVCDHPDPTPEHEQEYGGDNLDPFTMSLNTVRGKAFHSLFAYMFWCNRNLRKRGKYKRNRLVKEVKRVLEEHLDVDKEASLTIRSVYGRHLPWLYSFDKNWTTGIVNRLFPREDKDRRFAAWEAYLSNDVFEKLFKTLRAQYRLAIHELDFTPKRRLWIDPVKKLAQHVIIAYLYDCDSRKSPLYKEFFREADGTVKGMAVGSAGRAYVTCDKTDKKKRFPDKNRLQDLWEWRLRESTDTEELEQFGWWVRRDVFENQWMLEKLNETLDKTKGVIAAEFEVSKTLADLAADHPYLAASALYLIVKAGKNRPSYLRDKEIKAVLTELYKTKDSKVHRIGDKIKDYLLKLGSQSFRNVGRNPEIGGSND